jgi:copper chaperone
MNEITIEVGGMSCGGCARNVSKALKNLPGVSEVDVSLERDSATVRYDAAQVDVAAMRQAVEEAGFEAPQ